MDLNAVVGLAGALIALIALWFSWQNVRVAKEQAAAAVEQTQIQRQMHRDAAQPYIWADVRGDPSQRSALAIIVGNSGQTTARNVRVIFDPPMPQGPNPTARGVEGQERLRDGINALAPGAQLMWALGVARDVISREPEQKHTITIEAEGPFGPVEVQKYDLDLADLRHTRDEPPGSLLRLTEAVEKAGKKVADAIDKTTPPPPVHLLPPRGI